MKRICHRTMGSAKKEECIEEACTAWAPIGGTAKDPRYGCIEVDAWNQAGM